MSRLWAVSGRAPWVKARPPGARPRAPTPGLAPVQKMVFRVPRPVTRVQAMDTEKHFLYSSLGSSELPFVWPFPPDLFAMGDPIRGIQTPDN